MKSHFKPLGKFIRPVAERNVQLRNIPLMGLSINKYFIPSIANTIGTDISTYRLIKKNQFAYGPVTSRNGDKITIALFKDHEEALISQAYVPFEVIDENVLDSEYLMMWFRRPEFDRYARFKSHGSAREIFGWEELCETLVPVLPIDSQKTLVAEYKVIQNRLKLNQIFIQKLEESTQAIYKELVITNVDLENLPSGWRKSKIGAEVNTLGGGTPSTEEQEYWENGKIMWFSPTDITSNDSLFISNSESKITERGLQNSSAKLFPAYSLMMTSRATIGKVAINTIEATTNQGFITLIPNEEISVYFLYEWIRTQIEEIVNLASGSTFPEISKTDFRNLNIVVPDRDVLAKFSDMTSPIFELIKTKNQESQKLEELKDLMLAKMASL